MYMWFSGKCTKSLLYLLISLHVPEVGCEAVRAGLAAVFGWGACAKAPDVALIREDYTIYWNSDTSLGAKPPSNHCVDPKGDDEHLQLLDVIPVVLYHTRISSSTISDEHWHMWLPSGWKFYYRSCLISFLPSKGW
ncbi:uncharacterized protein F5891DRAFT_535617 [Suillus fuscotomentosus]|uniref:Uncharacterized protein n=1 Tax=Suillus fuscotomentosus TaxID=1912939 RepID=A0AAD4E095_9AGAM|nr:uncharacterized protein F5891DRAFT_535617 [Suillus fuscotomentosus]KAG1897366.1 hypothetical protein F5891DRAFT_535617 [Suillus fuscotomentosus]